MDIRTLNGSTLAYFGDSVIELFIRRQALESDVGDVGRLNEMVISRVKASAQSAAMDKIEPHLTEEELDYFKRGRNTHLSVPKSATARDYRRATGMESLFAYLYLTDKQERITELLKIGYDE